MESVMEFTREIYWNIGHGPATLVPMYLFAVLAMAALVYGFVRRLRVYRLGKPMMRTDQPFARFAEMMRTMLLQTRVPGQVLPMLCSSGVFSCFLSGPD